MGMSLLSYMRLSDQSIDRKALKALLEDMIRLDKKLTSFRESGSSVRGIPSQRRYVLISELSYALGEERRTAGLKSDPAQDWAEAEKRISAMLGEKRP